MEQSAFKSEKWADHELFSQPDIYELLLCHNYHIYLRTLKQLILPKSNLLYSGCGTGKLSKMLAQSNINIFAFDINPEAIRYARLKHAHPDVSYFVDNMCNVGVAANIQFETLLSLNNTFRHLLMEEEVNLFFDMAIEKIGINGSLILHLSFTDNLQNERVTRKWHLNLTNKHKSITSEVAVTWQASRLSANLSSELLSAKFNNIQNKDKIMQFKFIQRVWSYDNMLKKLKQFGFQVHKLLDDCGNRLNEKQLRNKNIFLVAKRV